MTFRHAALTLAAPVLSLALVGCQPPLEEKKDGGMAPAPTAGEPAPTAPTPAPAPADVKPTEPTTPAVEAPKETSAPVVAPAPEEPKKEEMPKS